MLKISKQQALNRWDILPDNLKEALFSESNADILWLICEAQHIPEQKIYTIATIAGDVILGFLHSEDLAKEIRTTLNLNPEIANSIANEIDRKIFVPIRSAEITRLCVERCSIVVWVSCTGKKPYSLSYV